MPVHREPSLVSMPPRRGWRVAALACVALAVLVGATVFLQPLTRSAVSAAPLQETLTPTPTATPEQILDVSNAQPLMCGGYYNGETLTRVNNVSSYACHPTWDESGPEAVYRLEVEASQPVTVTLLNASADLDVFFLRYALPSACVAGGDNYLTYKAQPGIYFLSVDGYRGAAGTFSFRVDCPVNTQATPTPTFTPSPTPTLTPVGTATPTATGGPQPQLGHVYLPVILRSGQNTGPTVTLTLQEELNGYAGTTDTTLDSWEPQTPQGDDNRLRLFYARPPKVTTQMAPAVRFDLSLLPASAQVKSAVLRLYVPSAPAYDVRARAQGLLKPWDEAGATWEVTATGVPWDKPGAASEGVDRTAWATEWQRIAEGERWYEFDITSPAQGWARDPATNHGVVLEAGPGDDDATVQTLFVSREGNGRYRPQLILTYALPVQ